MAPFSLAGRPAKRSPAGPCYGVLGVLSAAGRPARNRAMKPFGSSWKRSSAGAVASLRRGGGAARGRHLR